MSLLSRKEIKKKGVLSHRWVSKSRRNVARKRDDIIPEKEELACVYLASLIIELSYGRFCFLSIRFDCVGTRYDTFERWNTPGAIYRGNFACLRTTSHYPLTSSIRVDTSIRISENVITRESVIDILFSLDTMKRTEEAVARRWSILLVEFNRE